jgi:hypothetical protein
VRVAVAVVLMVLVEQGALAGVVMAELKAPTIKQPVL